MIARIEKFRRGKDRHESAAEAGKRLAACLERSDERDPMLRCCGYD
jgi:hypothetical protein